MNARVHRLSLLGRRDPTHEESRPQHRHTIVHQVATEVVRDLPCQAVPSNLPVTVEWAHTGPHTQQGRPILSARLINQYSRVFFSFF